MKSLLFVVTVALLVAITSAIQTSEPISSTTLSSDIGINDREMGDIVSTLNNEKISSYLLTKSSWEYVDVYINMNSINDIKFILPYVVEIVDIDIPTQTIVAKVRQENLNSISMLHAVQSIQPVIPPIVFSGKYVTEGDKILLADQVRSKYGVTGAGIKVGVTTPTNKFVGF